MTIVTHPLYNIINWLSIPNIHGVDIKTTTLLKLEPLLLHEVEKWMISYVDYRDADKNNYLTSTILKEAVNSFTKAFNKNGLRVGSIKPADLGLENLLKDYLTSEDNKEKNISIMNLGEECTSVSFYKNNELFITRNISVGLNKFIKSIMSQMNITDKEAKEFFFESVIFLDGELAEQNKIKNYNIIRPIFGELIKETYNSNDAYLARYREFNINEILLCGPVSNIRNINHVIKMHLKVPAKHLSDIVSVYDNLSDDGKLNNQNVNNFVNVLEGCYPNRWDYLGENISYIKEPRKKIFSGLVKSLGKLFESDEIAPDKPVPGYVLVQESDDKTLVHVCTDYSMCRDGFYKLKNGSGPGGASIFKVDANDVSRVYKVENVNNIYPNSFLDKEFGKKLIPVGSLNEDSRKKKKV